MSVTDPGGKLLSRLQVAADNLYSAERTSTSTSTGRARLMTRTTTARREAGETEG